MLAAATVTALSPFVMFSGKLFLSYTGLPASSFPLSQSSRCSSFSTRPSPEQQRGKGLNSVVLIASGECLGLAAAACAFPSAASAALLTLKEPQNALSLPTWVIHVSSVIEWIAAMVLVWEYGEKSGFSAWKGLSWGMMAQHSNKRRRTQQATEELDTVSDTVHPSIVRLRGSHRAAHLDAVPLLGGAMCACTWHFFYNSESLEILVAVQGALTVVGNMTMCIAAFRIFKASLGSSNNS